MKERIYYRGDKELYRRAKSQAALEGKPVGDFIDESIKEKLNRVGNIENKQKGIHTPAK